MTSPSMLLPLFLLLASSSAWGMARAHGDENELTHIHIYMHEITSGADATTIVRLPPLGNTTFGMIKMFDDELRDGRDPSNSSLIGRFQGFNSFAGLVSPPGIVSSITFVFTAGNYSGSTLVMMGTVQSFTGAFERALVGGTGAFSMTRGYCLVEALWYPTPTSTVWDINLYLKMDD
ncbi:unnamed protein product [Alopecurus aequalis]